MPKHEQPLLTDLTSSAIAIAVDAHNHQTRKTGEDIIIPYICHPLEIVSRLMKSVGNNEILLAAAAVHDVVEDTDVTLDELGKKLPPKVIQIVACLSEGDYQGGVKPDKRTRKQKYIQQIINAPDHIQWEVQLISAVDKLASGEDYLADAHINPQTPENAALNLWFYSELMPTYFEVLKPYPRLYREMSNCWAGLQQIWSDLKF